MAAPSGVGVVTFFLTPVQLRTTGRFKGECEKNNLYIDQI